MSTYSTNYVINAFIESALSEADYHEYATNLTKYGADLDGVNFYGELKNGQPWASIFIHWSIFNILEDVVRETLSKKLFYLPVDSPISLGYLQEKSYFLAQNAWKSIETGYSPSPGDIVYYKLNDSIIHSGIVWKVAGDTISYIAGNLTRGEFGSSTGSWVARREFDKSSSKNLILGYGVLNWSAISSNNLKPIDNSDVDIGTFEPLPENEPQKPQFTEASIEVLQNSLTVFLNINNGNLALSEVTYEIKNKTNITEIPYSSSGGKAQFDINISSLNLKPDTSYMLTIRAKNAKGTSSKSIYFTTLQSFSKPIKSAILKYDIEIPAFILIFKDLDDWGYWGANKRGYKITWIVNGAERDSSFINYSTEHIKDGMITLNLEQPESLRITDRTGIQISIQTWVKNDLGIQILNTDKVITNCLYLKAGYSPVRPYLRLDQTLSRISLINNL